MDAKVGRYIVNGAHEGSKLQDMLDGFIRKFVLCPECDNPETELVRAVGSWCLIAGVMLLLPSDCAAKSQPDRADVQGLWLPWPPGHATQAHDLHPQEPTWAAGGRARKEVCTCLWCQPCLAALHVSLAGARGSKARARAVAKAGETRGQKHPPPLEQRSKGSRKMERTLTSLKW